MRRMASRDHTEHRDRISKRGWRRRADKRAGRYLDFTFVAVEARIRGPSSATRFGGHPIGILVRVIFVHHGEIPGKRRIS